MEEQAPVAVREQGVVWTAGDGGHALPAARRWARPRGLRYVLWLLGDVGAGALAFLLALVLRYRIAPAWDPRLAPTPPHMHLYAVAFWLYLPLLMAALGLAGAYRRPLAWTGPAEYRAVVQGVTFTLLTLLMATYLFDHANRLSRGWLLALWVLACGLVTGARLLARFLARRLAAAGVGGRRVLIVGTHPQALTMEWLLRRQGHLGLRVVGFAADDAPAGTIVQAGRPVLGRTADLRALIQAHGVDVVLISARTSSHAQVLAAVEATLGTQAEVVMSPDVFTVLSTGATVVPLPGMPVVMLSKLRLSWNERLVKELFDRLAALVLLVLLGPLLLALAAIARSRCGDVFERHMALGLGGRPFAALKFRTTPVEAASREEDRESALRRQKGLPVRGAPGLTSWGRVLRHTSLDELPQLWNVVRGQMSLVGPYKIAPQDLPHYGTRWLSVVTLKPGITGMAQVHGRGELTLEERSILDAEYVRDYSLGRDFALLLATVPTVLRGRGAF